LKKIKRFIINIRPSYFKRLLAGSKNMSREEVIACIDDNRKLISPCTIYESFSIGDLKDGKLKDAIRKAVPENTEINLYSVVSLLMVTVGDAIDKKLSAPGGTGDSPQVMEALGNEALEQSVSFVYKLIEKDAVEEDCVAGLPVRTDGYCAREISEMLDAGRIGIKSNDDFSIYPSRSAAAFCLWAPLKKKKRK